MEADLKEVEHIINNALREDIGSGDITSKLTIPADLTTEMAYVTRQDIIVSGMTVITHLLDNYNPKIQWESFVNDGDKITAGTQMLKITGNAIAIFSIERVSLNLLQHMSGVATMTRQYVDAVSHTGAKILDTRKTLPGLREIEKYAVSCGGATNHRMRLDDGILIKDNHVYAAGGISQAVKQAIDNKELRGDLKVEVECDTIDQVREALDAGADILLLDNMSIEELKEAVKINDGKAKLEASGGVTLEVVKDIAETGVDYISVGAITHSAPGVDIGLDKLC